MDKAFALIESSTLSQTTQLDRETEYISREESMIQMGLSTAFKGILSQGHPKIYQVVFLIF